MAAARAAGPAPRSAASGPDPSIEIDGDTAQARYDRSVTTLRRVDGVWLID